MAVLTKLSLKTAHDVRMIIAVTFLCFKVSDEDDLYKAVKTEYKNHAERTRGKTGHNEGGPDGPALVALLFVIMQKHKINETDTFGERDLEDDVTFDDVDEDEVDDVSSAT